MIASACWATTAAVAATTALLLGDSLPTGVGGAAGLAPHVLHHIGLLAGTAVVAGSGGTRLLPCWDWWPPSPSCGAFTVGSGRGGRRQGRVRVRGDVR